MHSNSREVQTLIWTDDAKRYTIDQEREDGECNRCGYGTGTKVF